MNRHRCRPVSSILSILLMASVWFFARPIGAQTVLPVGVNLQEHSEWCWAASTQSVLHLYGQSPSQCAIAEWARQQSPSQLGDADCCAMSTAFSVSAPCNNWNYNWGYPGSILEILEHFGVPNTGENHIAPRPMFTFDRVKQQIDARRPFIIRWARSNGGGHFIVGHGYADDAQQTMYFFDPWPGEGAHISSWSWVASDTTSGHTWEHTNVMQISPPPPAGDSETSSDTLADTDSPVDSDSLEPQDTATSADTDVDTNSPPGSDSGSEVDTDSGSGGAAPDMATDDSGDKDVDTDYGISTVDVAGDDGCGCAAVGKRSALSVVLRALLKL